MKKLTVAIIIALVFGFAFIVTGCGGIGGENEPRERVTVTFDIGYEGGISPAPITFFKGSSAGSIWHRNPTRTGWAFNGWRAGGITYTRTTIVNESVTVVAQWTEMKGLKITTGDAVAALFDTDAAENPFPRTLSDARKVWGMMNPSITFATTADPTPLIFCHAVPPCIQHSGNTEVFENGVQEFNYCDECTLYIYGSNDTLSFVGGFGWNPDGTPTWSEAPDANVDTSDFGKTIQGLRIISTKDLVNWTEHGVVNAVGKTSTHALWHYTSADRLFPGSGAGEQNNTWAPSAEWTMVDGKPRVFLYYCDGGNNTNVMISDDPRGPFTRSARNLEIMINRSMPIGSGVGWLFDPGSMIDDDGRIYMVLGGEGSTVHPNNSRRTELSSAAANALFDTDHEVGIFSITTDRATFELPLPWHFEASDIWKWRGIYYVNYTSNWGSGKPSWVGSIDVMTVQNREGPLALFPTDNTAWGGPRRILPNSTDSGNYGDNTNHASLFDFKGKPYMVYHTQSAAQGYGGGRLRGAHITPITFNAQEQINNQNMGVNPAPYVSVVDGVEQTFNTNSNSTQVPSQVLQIGHFNPFAVQEAETVYITAGVYTKKDISRSNGAVIASIDSGDWMGVWGADFGHSPAIRTFNFIVKIPVTTDEDEGPYVGAIKIISNPRQDGIANPQHRTRLVDGARTRITGGEVIGLVQFEVFSKEDEGQWLQGSAPMDVALDGIHNLAFVFYSSRGSDIVNHSSRVTPATDARRRNVGFEIDQWWFE